MIAVMLANNSHWSKMVDGDWSVQRRASDDGLLLQDLKIGLEKYCATATTDWSLEGTICGNQGDTSRGAATIQRQPNKQLLNTQPWKVPYSTWNDANTFENWLIWIIYWTSVDILAAPLVHASSHATICGHIPWCSTGLLDVSNHMHPSYEPQPMEGIWPNLVAVNLTIVPWQFQAPVSVAFAFLLDAPRALAQLWMGSSEGSAWG